MNYTLTTSINLYWIKGMEIGYLKLSPLEALILASITHTSSSIINAPKNTNPIIMNIRGTQTSVYNNMDNWKLSEALPFSSIKGDSYLFDDQQIRGPIIPPKGTTTLANELRWQNIAQFLSDSVKTLISVISVIYYKDYYSALSLHHLKRPILFMSAARRPLLFFAVTLCSP